ncbi:hypothetical protein QEH56_08515 [Pelagicoccus enzymogenes]|uniref:hypothetical protein n=1 Tax=Pelagicoccus enzymogenes TaxID=2773457 RepID=UPI00280EF65C|nr:hypothetical protein [Pelagicoccus enzymogenes]MDQ8198185.1 hypothetical protein [Pelagicoccus enzymogenes]
MSLQQWHKNGWLKPHSTTPSQIKELWEIAERDLKDAKTARLSSDWQFGIAYNAALKLCAILLYAEGYRADRNLAHYRTLQALAQILGKDRQDDADYLDTCRVKRNTAEYDLVGQISDDEAAELIEFAEELKADVLNWLSSNRPNLTPKT